MRLFRYLSTVALSLAFVAATVSAEEPVRAGKVSFANPFRLGSESFEKGRYEVRLEHASDGIFIVLARDGNDVLREIAIVLEAKGNVKGAHASLSSLGRDGGRIRLAVRAGKATYLAFFEPGA